MVSFSEATGRQVNFLFAEKLPKRDKRRKVAIQITERDKSVDVTQFGRTIASHCIAHRRATRDSPSSRQAFN